MSYPKTKQMNLEDGQTLLAAVDGKMSDLKSALSNTQGDVTNVEDNLYSYKTTSGNPVIVEDAVADAVKTMRIEIAPVQDLHGYDNPWSGGAGKNIWDRQTYGLSQGYYIRYSNGTSNGGNQDYCATLDYIPIPSGHEGETLYSNFTVGGSTPGMAFYDENKDFINESGSKNFPVTVPTGAKYFRFTINSTDVNSDLIVTFSSDTSFAPYSNLCPISGWTECKVTDTGKNLLIGDYTWTQAIRGDDGTSVSNPASHYTEPIYNIKPNTSYTLSGNLVGSGTQLPIGFRVYFLEADGSWISRTGVNNSAPYTFTTPNDCRAIQIQVATALTLSDAMLEIGQSASPYEPLGTVSTIPFGQTIYGAELTINRDGTGQAIPDKINVDLSTLTWTTRYTGETKKCVSASLPENYFSGDSNLYLIAENYAFKGYANTSSIFADPDTVEYGVYAYRTTSTTISTTLYCILDIDQNPTGNVVYKTAETLSPIPITAPQIQLLTGYNTVYADTGAILSMLYPVEKYQTVEQADKERIHVMDTAEEPVKLFADGAYGLPMAMQIKIKPYQNLNRMEHPYPAGTTNNLIPDGTDANNGFVDSNWLASDGTVSRNSVAYVSEYFPVAGGETYTFSNNVGEGAVDQSVCFYDSEKNYISGENANGQYSRTFQAPSNAVYARSTQYKKCYKTLFQFEQGSVATTIMEYSNVCPIEAVSDVCVVTARKNLSGYGNDIYYKIGAGSSYKYKYRALAKIPVTKGEKYRISLRRDVTSAIQHRHIIGFTDDDIPELTNYSLVSGADIHDFWSALINDHHFTFMNIVANNSDNTYVMEATGKYFYIMYANLNTFGSGHDIYDFIITHGEESVSYEDGGNVPYSIDLPNGQTVYGGTLTINKDWTGSLIVDHSMIDLGDYTWTYNSAQQRFYTQEPTASFLPSSSTVPSDIICSNYRTSLYSEITGATVDKAIGGAIGSGIKYISVRDTSYSDETAFKTAMSGVKAVILLETPSEPIPLTAPQVLSLLGVNNLYTDCGDILSADYSADTKLYVDDKIAKLTASQRLMELIVTANREDSMVATKAYDTGDLLIVNGILYKASTSIANGATLTVGTNVIATTVATELAALA